MAEEGSIVCVSGVSAFTGEPFVSIELHEGKTIKQIGQVDPETCRGMAMQFLEAAEAAISDAAVMRLCKERLEIDDETAGLFVLDLRNFRADMQ